MPIVFDCPACRRRIQVPGEAAGAQALCPFCRNQIAVPLQSQTPQIPTPQQFGAPSVGAPSPGVPPHEPYWESGNPYEPPPIDEDRTNEPMPLAPPTDPVPTIISVGRMINSAWYVFTTFFLHHIVFGLAVWAVSGFLIIVGLVTSGGGEPSQESVIITLAIACVLGLVMVFVGPYLFCGMIVYGLYKMRGGKAGYERIFQGGRFFLRGIGLGLILWLLSFVPIALCALPMFLMAFSIGPDGDPDLSLMFAAFGAYALGAVISAILWVRLGFSWFFLVDRDMGVFDSLGASWTFTKGNALALFLTGFIYWILLAVLSQCCYIGTIIMPSFFLLASSLLYLKITGQPNVMYDPEEMTERW